MINFDDIARENIRKRYPNWVKISDSLYKKLIIGSSESKKQFHLFVNLVTNQILIRFNHMLRIHLKQNTKYQLINAYQLIKV